ncbi:MAG: hypothetical protein RLP44_11925, partial [Aggregatilineales bacterium]
MRLRKGDEGGDAGSEDHEDQTHDHLIGGFWIILMESNGSAVPPDEVGFHQALPEPDRQVSLHPAL